MMNTIKIETSYSNFGYGSLEHNNSSSFDSEENSSIESNQEIDRKVINKNTIFLKVMIASGLVLLITFAAITLKSIGIIIITITVC